MIGRHLGPYEITGKLGAGGMGEVYRQFDLIFGFGEELKRRIP